MRTFKEEWEEFAHKVYDGKLHENKQQHMQIHRAYFAGAFTCLTLLTEAGRLPDGQDDVEMDRLATELLNIVGDTLKAGRDRN